jgi:hypothetical protein
VPEVDIFSIFVTRTTHTLRHFVLGSWREAFLLKIQLSSPSGASLQNKTNNLTNLHRETKQNSHVENCRSSHPFTLFIMEKAILSNYNHSHSDDYAVKNVLIKNIQDGSWQKSEFTAMTDPLTVGWTVLDVYHDVSGNQFEAEFLAHHIACRNDSVPASFM